MSPANQSRQTDGFTFTEHGIFQLIPQGIDCYRRPVGVVCSVPTSKFLIFPKNRNARINQHIILFQYLLKKYLIMHIEQIVSAGILPHLPFGRQRVNREDSFLRICNFIYGLRSNNRISFVRHRIL